MPVFVTPFVQGLLGKVMSPLLRANITNRNLPRRLDGVSCSAAINACEKGKCWQEALRLPQEMLHRSLAPGAMSHSAAISACEKGKH